MLKFSRTHWKLEDVSRVRILGAILALQLICYMFVSKLYSISKFSSSVSYLVVRINQDNSNI